MLTLVYCCIQLHLAVLAGPHPPKWRDLLQRPVIVVLNKINEAGFEYLRERCNMQFVDADKASPAEIAAALKQADAIIVRAFKVTAAILDQAPRLVIVSKHGAGFETIDIEAASEHHILVSNTGAANAGSVAEYAVTLMLATLRKIPRMHQMVLDGRFKERISLVFGDLWGRTIGLIGYGNIGRIVARITAGGFSCRVIAYDPFIDAATMKADGVEKVEKLADLLAQADAVSIHTPLNAGTRGLIGAAELRLMKPSAVLVNTSRGAIIDQTALTAALKEGIIYGAGIDVFDPEPPTADHPLFADIENVVLSPHLGGATLASRRQTALEAAESALSALSGTRPKFLLNPDEWERRRTVVALG
jgi:D-3-phosphoglycerate dehydrogenase